MKKLKKTSLARFSSFLHFTLKMFPLKKLSYRSFMNFTTQNRLNGNVVFSTPNYLLKRFHWKKYRIKSYPTNLISLSQAERSDLYRIRNLCRIMEFLMETDPLSDTHFKTLR